MVYSTSQQDDLNTNQSAKQEESLKLESGANLHCLNIR